MIKYSFIFISSIILLSCVQEAESNGLGGYVDEEELFNQQIAEAATLEKENLANDSIVNDTSFIDFSNHLIDLLNQSKYSEFSSNFHPEKGCLFVPYTFIEGEEQNFTESTFTDALNSGEEFLWGFQDGSGDSINLDVNAYFNKYVYDINFKDLATDIHINGDLAFSNTLDNIFQYYPDADFIEFYYEGTSEYEGMDWSSLTFYIEKTNDNYALVAVVHNQWTI